MIGIRKGPRRWRWGVCWCVLLLGFGCEESGAPKGAEEVLLAEVAGLSLYASELPEGLDTSQAVRRAWIDHWINEELLAKAALEEEDLDMVGIEQQVATYRHALLQDALKRMYLRKHMDTTVSQPELLGAYEQERENHFLATDILRFAYIRIPRDMANVEQYRRAWKQAPAGLEHPLVLRFCSQEIGACKLNTEQWQEQRDLLDLLPEQERDAVASRLGRQQFFELKDKNHEYLIYIAGYQRAGTVPPLPYIERDLHYNILIQRKKIALGELYKSLREDAEKTKSYKVYF